MAATVPVSAPAPRLEAGFLDGRRGPLFHVDALPRGAAQACVLFVHAWGEEVAKSRHMVSATARRLAAAGVAVRCLDLYGCGDSAGALEDASVQAWLSDLGDAVVALETRHGVPCHLWGQRAGALLAGAVAASAGDPRRRLLLWQPVLRGRQVVTEFLRLRAMASMMRGGERETESGLRERLDAEGVLEVAGYRVSAELARGLDALAMPAAPPTSTVHWFDVGSDPGRALAPAQRKRVDEWTAAGAQVRVERVAGPPFWASGELAHCDELVERTAAIASELGT